MEWKIAKGGNSGIFYLAQEFYTIGNDGKMNVEPIYISAPEYQVLDNENHPDAKLGKDNSHCVLFMDEPEASLHIEWQQKLIAMIRELNPNVQIILTTHSPAVIMEGWLDAVTEVSDISTLYNNGNFTTR